MTKELVATYYIYDHQYNLYAFYDTWIDFEHKNVAFYDIYDEDGVSLTQDHHYYDFPSWNTIFNTVTAV